MNGVQNVVGNVTGAAQAAGNFAGKATLGMVSGATKATQNVAGAGIHMTKTVVSGATNAAGKTAGLGLKATKTVVSGATNAAGITAGLGLKATKTVVTGASKATQNVAEAGLKATKTVVTGATNAVTNTAGVMTGAVTGVANVGMAATVGVAGAVTGVATATMGATAATMSTVMRSTMINPRRKKYIGGRRLKRQNSRLAWESRVTAPYIKLDLIMKCHRLPKKNSFSQADAFCCLWEIPSGHRINSKKVSRLPARHEKEIGRTEVCRENRNPSFKTTFRLEYKFQEEQHFVIRVYNEDLQYSTDLKEHDFIGGCFFTLGELMGAGGCSVARPLQHGKSFLILMGQEIVETREVLEFRFSGQDLGLLERKRKNMQVAKELTKDVLDTMQKVNIATVLEKFDPYFRFEKLNKEDQTWKTVWKSEVIKDNQNPTWEGARIPLQLLCDDDPYTTVRITIWDYHKHSPDILLGFVETTVNELIQKSQRGIPVFNVMIEKKRILRGTKLKKAGVLKVLKSNILQIPSMLQYISGGCKMDLMFAIDCTKANGDWRDESSQHYHSSTWLNDYQAAIHKIATVYGSFEGDKDYILWGYGACINGQQTHSPFLMGEKLKDADALVESYDAYFSATNESFDLGKDGYLKPVIQAGMYRAIKSNQTSQCYSTLVILTTGEITDLTDTIDVICAAAEDAPLSIVIIGVGTGDFQLMDILTGYGDESGKLRHSNGVPIARELVSFVTFHEFGGNASQCVVEGLREVPEQFVQYFTNAGIKPLPPKPVPDFTGEESRSRSSNSANRRKGPERHHSHDDDSAFDDLR
jgi:Copine/C2 domain